MKAKKVFVLAMTAVLGLATAGFAVSAEEQAQEDALAFNEENVTATELNVTVDGEPVKVMEYVACYVKNPTNVAMQPNEDGIDQKVSIYVPEGADENSPIIFYVNNSGWLADAYEMREKVEDGKAYVSDSDSDKIGMNLAKNYVIVSYGCRSRNDSADENGKYVSHAPATMTDTKAVIRYLRYNKDLLPAGNTERIVITGTSGGGALSTIIASSGNSEDFYESLYEIGAAGIVLNEDGTYSSEEGIGDEIFATIAYCPINDLRMASEAYEWTYYETRQRIIDTLGEDAMTAFQDDLSDTYGTEELMAASAELKETYSEYVDSLGLKMEDGSDLTSENLEDAIIALLEREFDEAVVEVGIEQMKIDSSSRPVVANGLEYDSSSEDWVEWLTFNEDGTYTFSYDDYLYWLAVNTKLKLAPAFSNLGMGIAQQNEDSLYGSEDAQYCPFTEYSWNHDSAENGYGLDETGLTWDEYLETEEGAELTMQLQMTSPIPYLTSDNGESAPYWYVRHGAADRDTSYALQTVLYYSLINDDTIADVNFELAWLKPHSGDYDVQEAYAWLEEVLAEAE